MRDDDLFPFLILGKILFWVLVWYLIWGRKRAPRRTQLNDSTAPAKQPKGRSFGWTHIPILGRILLERERQARAAQKRREDEEARARADRDRAQREYDALIGRPIPPDVARDMKSFMSGEFSGEDRSPLAYVGYRVGKTRGLPTRERQRRLAICFRIDIPANLDAKYQAWGPPATYQRYHSIERHLKMLADLRSGRNNQRFAVADWKTDRAWFLSEYQEIASLMRRYPPRRSW